MSDQLLQHQLEQVLKQAARSAAVADKGVVLDVTWYEPNVAEALHLIHTRMREWSGQTLVAQTAVFDTLLDLAKLLTTEEVKVQ